MSLTLTALKGIPLVESGDDLAALLVRSFAANGITPKDRDVVVIAQKIVSKSQGRTRRMRDIRATDRAQIIAAEIDKDPALVQAILDETSQIVRKARGVLIVRDKRGLVMANAGIDRSNVSGDDVLLLLPQDPDASAKAIRDALAETTGKQLGVIISDSFGRPFRQGVTGIAIGAAGVQSFVDRRGDKDLFGRELMVSTIAHADEIAGAASILMGQADEGIPAVHLRGDGLIAGESPASDLRRAREQDLFL